MMLVRSMVAAVALGSLVACSGDSSLSHTDTSVPTSSSWSDTTPPSDSSLPRSTVRPLAHPIVESGREQVDAELLRLARFVEAQRGRPFLRPVAVQFLDDDAFETVVLAEMDADDSIAALEDQRDFLVVMGVIPADTDFVGLVRVNMREGVVGLYDPSTEELFVRGEELAPYVQSTVVHELTHALDDQWFGMPHAVEVDADQQFARAALAEGSATWVEDRFIDQMSVDELAAAKQSASDYLAQMEIGPMPVALAEISESVYTLGNDFVTSLISEGGTDALDSAYGAPPSSTEQLLHPDVYRTDDQPLVVPQPTVSGTVVSVGVVGELSLVELLNTQLAPTDARVAAAGWGGDQYVIYTTGGERCVRLDVEMDDAEEARELFLTLGRWSVRQIHSSVERRGDTTVRLDVCVDDPRG